MDFTLRYGLGLYPQEGMRKSFYGSAVVHLFYREKRENIHSQKRLKELLYFSDIYKNKWLNFK